MSHLQQRGPVQVTLERGMLRLRRGNPQAEGLYDQDTTNALRAFFQAERDEQLGRWVGEVVSCPRQCRRHHKPEPSSSVVFLHEDGVKQTPAERFASWLLERKASRQAAREYEARRCYPSSTRPNY